MNLSSALLSVASMADVRETQRGHLYASVKPVTRVSRARRRALAAQHATTMVSAQFRTGQQTVYVKKDLLGDHVGLLALRSAMAVVHVT